MARKRRSSKPAPPAKTDQLYRLDELNGDWTQEFRAADDVLALSKVTNLLTFDERQRAFRDGEVLPYGDFMLYRVGPSVDEPYMRFRKLGEPRASVSWEAA